MQKRLAASIWPLPQTGPVAPSLPPHLSPMDKINQLRTEMPQAGYIRQALLIPYIIPISPATLWRWIKTQQFPQAVRLSPRVTAWRVDDIIKWLSNK